MGLRGRYGQDVNAISLICDTFNVPPLTDAVVHPNQPAPPTPNNLPIKVTGVQSGAANRWPASLFPGDWAVRSNMGTFELDMVQLSSSTLFGDIANGNAVDKGTLRGTQSDSLHAQLTLKQPGRNRSGTISITVSSDGKSFTGSGTLSDGQPITWRGTKKPPAAH